MQSTISLDANPQSPLPAESLWWAKAIAIFTVALGLIVLCGWALGTDALKRLLPGLVSMKANTAAAFSLSGISLYLHTLRQISPITLMARRLGAALVLLLGLTTLSEHYFDWNAGIDQLLFSEPAGEILTSHPGRMSSITAANFALTGGALLFMEAAFWMAAQAMAFAVMVFALMPLGGYMFGNLSSTHIGSTTAIAAHTVAGFLMLSTGVLAATQNHGLMLRLRKKLLVIGLAISLITLIVIFGAASYNFVQKDKASQWVEHTYEIIQSMESFSDSLHDFLNHNRGFLLTGDDRQLVERDKRRDAMLAELARVHQMTSHNALQQKRLEALNKLVAQRMERADQVVRLRRERGSAAATAMIFSGNGDTMTDEIEAKLDELENTEKDLLKERQRIAEVMSASSLFTLGTLATASFLLLLWVFRTSQREITERKKSEEYLRISEERLALAVHTGGIGIWDWDVVENKLVWDDSMYRLYGIRREDFGGAYEAWVSALHPEDKAYTEAEIQAALRGEREYAPEFRVVWPDGSIHYIKAASHTLFDDKGRPLRMVGINYDLTERKLAENELREKEERLALSTLQNGVGVWDWNLVTQEMIWDDSMFALYRIRREDFIGTEEAWRAALHPDDLHRGDREVDDAIAGIKPFDTEFRVVWPNGEIRHIKAVAKVFRDGQETPLRMLGINMDITDRKQAEESLRASKERLHAIIENSMDAMVQMNGEGIIVGWNRQMEKVFGWTRAEAIGRVLHETIIPPQQREAHVQGLKYFLLTGEGPVLNKRIEVAGLHRDGHVFPVELTVTSIKMGDKYEFSAFLRDITEAKRAADEIYRLNTELEQRVVERTASLEAANKDMESFSYSISHDLRAPLRAINGFSKILQEEYIDRLDDEGRRLLNVVGGNAQKMGELIDDILAFSRAGRNEIERSVIDMGKMVAGVWEELKPEMAGRNVHLELRDMPPAEGDAAMLHQVIFNLLSNAVKFTQHNEDARIEVGGQADVHETVYHVKDNGVGFDMQYADKLFGVFLRLHGMDEFEGTGIGLAIVKRIITKHGGRVWAEGKVDGGATFYFALPMK